jgi:CheY-like chemotaxis protein
MPRLLVADDNDDHREMMAEAFRHTNLEADFAANGDEALNKYAEAIIANHPYDLLILDVAMPDMTGIRVGEIIRQSNYQTPLIFYTAYPAAVSHGRAAMLEGAIFLEKPLEITELIEKVNETLKGRST